MLRVAICDDDAAEADRVAGIVRAYADFDVVSYTSSRELAGHIMDGAVFDLYLLDVVMPPPDGIDLARLIRESDDTAAILYLTSHDGRALDAFRVRASQYLVKPVDGDTLRRELDVALAAVQARNAKTFLLKTKDGTVALPFHRIAYCELHGRILRCVASDGEEHCGVTLRTSFDAAVAPLMADSRFIRPHTSFAANLDHVLSIQGNALLMKTGVSLPIAHGAARETKKRYLQHFFRGERE